MDPLQEITLLKQQLEAERSARKVLEQEVQLLQEQKAALNDIVASEQRKFFQTILDAIPADIAVFDNEHRYLFVNPIAIRNPKIRAWIVGKRDEDYVAFRGKDPALVAPRRKIFNDVLQSKLQLEWEEGIVNPEGQQEYYLRKMYPVLDDNDEVKFVIGYGINITQRKIAEYATERSEKRYRELFDYSQALICTHDLDGKLLSVNPAICKALGYERTELVGRFLQEFVPAAGIETFNEVYLKTILSQGFDSGVFVVTNKEGKELYLLFQNYKREEQGSEPYIIGFAQDITERIEAEKALTLAKKMTEEMAFAKEAFLAKMSHEIRTPMNGVIGVAALLAKTRLNSEQQQYLKLLQGSANSLVMIVNDILDLEKIVMGKLELEQITFLLKEKVELCVKSFEYKATEKDLRLSLQFDMDLDRPVNGDPYRLTQVLNNLISNALKFTDKGSVEITLRLLSSDEEKGMLSVEVADTGIGIAQDMLANIFDPFVQATQSVTRMYGGTGLGLSICKDLVTMMGGELSVESRLNAGSIFRFTLPLRWATLELKDSPATLPLDYYKSLGRKHVLLTEDVELNQFVARHIMEGWGFEVTMANNGREAVDLLFQQEFDLVLMDIQMPVMDGMEATRRIRQMKDPSRAHVPIIALTANALKGDYEKYLAAGMNDYLAKPFDESKLFEVISKNLFAKDHRNQTPDRVDHHQSNILEMGNKLYDLSLVDMISGGDETFKLKMISIFSDAMPQEMEQLEASLLAEHWEQLGKIAHKMKSSIDSMGVASIKEDIRILEECGKTASNLEDLPGLIAKVKEHLTICIAQLKKDFQL